MKRLKYQFNNPVNKGTKENPEWEDNLLEKIMSYSEANEEIAKREAHNGKYTIEDDGIEEIPTPTELDKLDARLTYVEMMTGILEE